MERLTKRIDDEAVFKECACKCKDCVGGAWPCVRPILTRLAAYEDTGLDPERIAELSQAEADERLVVLPCKAGDTLWTFYTFPRSKVYSFIVTDTSTLNGATTLNTDRLGVIPVSDVGKTVFMTREAAEAALKKWEATHGV